MNQKKKTHNMEMYIADCLLKGHIIETVVYKFTKW